jgi:hypothetical protein
VGSIKLLSETQHINDGNKVQTRDFHCHGIILNHYLSQKFKLIEIDKFNHLINILTSSEYVKVL